jgi:hypothetical protein
MIRFLPFLFLATAASAWVANEVNFPGVRPGWDLGAVSGSYKFTGPDGSKE